MTRSHSEGKSCESRPEVQVVQNQRSTCAADRSVGKTADLHSVAHLEVL